MATGLCLVNDDLWIFGEPAEARKYTLGCTSPPTPAPSVDTTTSAVDTSTAMDTTIRSPPPPTNTAECPRNCGLPALGGGTCRSNGRCTSCNANRLRINGRCVNSLSCKGRRIQTGSMAGDGCRCLNGHCHFCTRIVAGDTCRVSGNGCVGVRLGCSSRGRSGAPSPALTLHAPSALV